MEIGDFFPGFFSVVVVFSFNFNLLKSILRLILDVFLPDKVYFIFHFDFRFFNALPRNEKETTRKEHKNKLMRILWCNRAMLRRHNAKHEE